MSEQKRNIEGDKRAASLSLRPRKAQTNTFGRGFELSPKATEMDIIENQRRHVCFQSKFGRFVRNK